MKYFKHLLFSFFSIFLFTACSSDDDSTPPITAPSGDYVDGFFVVNEGPFGGSGSLTFMADDFSETINQAFATENPNEDIGSFVQSVFFDEERMFIISNGSNLINVVNRYSLEFIALIDSGFEVPRYGVVLGDKAYVTNLADFDDTTDDFISVIDLTTYQVESSIPVNNIANYIEAYNGKLIVQNAAFSMGNTLSLINPTSQQVEQVIEVGEGLNSMVLHENELLTLSAEQFSRVDLSFFQVVSSIVFSEDQSGFRNLELDQNQLYYTQGNSVFTASLDEINFEENEVFSYNTTSDFGVFYGFAVHGNYIYIADAGDFASDGNVFVYSTNGNLLFESEVGLGPNGFYFN